MKKMMIIPAMLTAMVMTGQTPLVYDTECAPIIFPKIDTPPIDSLSWNFHLPDPLKLTDGSKVCTLEQWERRRDEIIQLLYHYEIGQKPYTPRDSIEAWMDSDTLCVNIHGNSNVLKMKAAIKYPEGEGPFPAIIGVGFGSGSLPHEMFDRRGIAQIAYWFPDVMSHTQKRGEEPINRILPEYEEIGAYSAWPWGVSRLIDAIEIIGERSKIDTKHIGITGCSFAGKMALFSGALDRRIALTIAQEPGGGGAAAWRVSDGLGWVETLGRTNYSWFLESMRQFSDYNVYRLPLDHHEVVSLIAPRAVLILGNTDYEWLADESGYVSTLAAKKVWEKFGIGDRIGYSIEANHPHCMLPVTQYPEVEAFIDRFLLDKDVDTNVAKAPMFEHVDYEKWLDR